MAILATHSRFSYSGFSQLRTAMSSTMNVSLTPELARFARAMVESGRYSSASEVVRNALRLLEEREAETAHLRGLMQDALESGPAVPFDGERIRQRLRARAAELRAQG